MAAKQVETNDSVNYLKISKKQIQVLGWLKEVYEESEVPQFERNEANINKLHQLMTLHKEAFSDLENVNNYLKSKCAAREKYYEKVKHNLEELFSSSLKLDPEEQICLDTLGSLHQMLHLHSSSPSNFMLAINSLEEEYSNVSENLDKEKRLTVNLLDLTKNIANNLEQLKSVAEYADQDARAREEELEKEDKRTNFNKEKMKKYEEDLKMLEAKLKKVGFQEDLKFTCISKKIDHLTELDNELSEKKETLNNYSLPPDITLAEIKVEEMRGKLSETMTHISRAYANQN